jgi:hypothetical protein
MMVKGMRREKVEEGTRIFINEQRRGIEGKRNYLMSSQKDMNFKVEFVFLAWKVRNMTIRY